MRVAGLMSGTSMDGIDAAAVDIEPGGVRLLEYFCTPYQPALRAALERSESWGSDCLSRVSSLNFEVGEAFADAAVRLKDKIEGIQLIGSHGQTVFHEPRPPPHSGRVPSTLQIGEPAIIVQRTGITTIADFRVADLAAGGQGAPLVSFVDYQFIANTAECRVALNIGGVANVTVMPQGAMLEDVRAFDSGPGNILIDRAVRSLFPLGDGFDRDGRIAAAERVNRELLVWLLSDPYVTQPAPKTTGREHFGADFFERLLGVARGLACSNGEIVATLTEFTARTIAMSIPTGCNTIVVSGGGAHNKALLAALERCLRDRGLQPGIVPSNEFGLDVDAKEAIAFAILAHEALHGKYNSLPLVTGARSAAVMGKIVPGANFISLMRSVWK